MSNVWDDGYMSEITYTHGFYRELAPNLLAFAALAAGHSAPDPTLPLTYCELGCGQGFTTNLLAACNPHIQFYANDFNPSQIAGARGLAADAGVGNVHFLESSFAEMADRTDLPEFDIIVLHGVYSWISAENRQAIVRFMARRLKVGGLVYLSYNTMPGWAAFMPLRRLLVDNATGTDGSLTKRIDQSLKAAEALAAANARYFTSNPGVPDRLKHIDGQSRAYIAHEYLNRYFSPFYHTDIVDEMSAARLTWIAPARPLEGIDNLNFTEAQLALLATIPQRSRQEGMKDYILNQQFRRDIFMKGPLPLHTVQADAIWAQSSFVLTVPASSLTELTVITPLGQLGLAADIYRSVVNCLAHGPATAGNLQAALPQLSFAQICQALIILVAQGSAHPCATLEMAASVRPQTDRFNRAVMARARFSGDLSYLASPLTGTAIAMDQMTQMLLSAHLTGGAADPVSSVWAHMKACNQRFVRDGQMLMNDSDNLTELRRRYDTLLQETWPTLRNLQIV